MNLFNRILIVLELVVAIVGSLALIALLLVNRAAIQTLATPAITTLSAATINVAQVICLGVLVLVLAFAILLLLLEFQRTPVRRLRVETIQGAEVLMTPDAITQQLAYALDGLSSVIKVQPQVQAAPKNEGVDISIELWTTADVDVKAKTEEAAGVARQTVEDRLGLKVHKVQIKIEEMKAPARKSSLPIISRSSGGENKL